MCSAIGSHPLPRYLASVHAFSNLVQAILPMLPSFTPFLQDDALSIRSNGHDSQPPGGIFFVFVFLLLTNRSRAITLEQ